MSQQIKKNRLGQDWILKTSQDHLKITLTIELDRRKAALNFTSQHLQVEVHLT